MKSMSMLLALTCWLIPTAQAPLVAEKDAPSKIMNEEKAIEATISAFVNAYNAGDLDRVLAYYGEDLIKVRHGAPPETKSDTARRLAAVFDKFRSRVEVVTDEIRISGEMAFTRGSFRVTLTPQAGGEAQVIARRYLEIWRQEGGRWLVVRTMDNID